MYMSIPLNPVCQTVGNNQFTSWLFMGGNFSNGGQAPLAPAQQQTRHTQLLLSIDGTDRQTDTQTPDRFIDPVVHTAYCTSLAFVDNTIYDTGHGHLPYRIGAALC